MINWLEKKYNIKPSEIVTKENLENLRNKVQLYQKKYSTVFEKVKNCIYRISNDHLNGIGFFVKINYQSESLKVLITNYNVFSETDFINTKKIIFYLYNQENKKTINLTGKRKIYLNKEFDISIIQINDEDEINNFLKLDDEIVKYLDKNEEEIIKHFNNNNKYNSIYVFNYKNSDVKISFLGPLTRIFKNKMLYQCYICEDTSFSPIISLNNNKLIGIHYESSEKDEDEFYEGLFILFPIIEFIKCKNIINIDKEVENKIDIEQSKEEERELIEDDNCNISKMKKDNKNTDVNDNLNINQDNGTNLDNMGNNDINMMMGMNNNMMNNMMMPMNNNSNMMMQMNNNIMMPMNNNMMMQMNNNMMMPMNNNMMMPMNNNMMMPMNNNMIMMQMNNNMMMPMNNNMMMPMNDSMMVPMNFNNANFNIMSNMGMNNKN